MTHVLLDDTDNIGPWAVRTGLNFVQIDEKNNIPALAYHLHNAIIALAGVRTGKIRRKRVSNG